jgi:hypothetical protein
MSKRLSMVAACAGAASVNTATSAAAAANMNSRIMIIAWPLLPT